jgi:hypothetical protein
VARLPIAGPSQTSYKRTQSLHDVAQRHLAVLNNQLSQKAERGLCSSPQSGGLTRTPNRI